MTGLHSERVKLSKIHNTPKKGHQLGTSSAAWKKIKSATFNSNSKRTTTSIKSQSNLLDASNNSSTIIDYGSNGEIYVVYPLENLVEVWDWIPPSSNVKIENDTLHLHGQFQIKCPNLETRSIISGDSECDMDRKIDKVRYLSGSFRSEISMLFLIKENNFVRFEIHAISPDYYKTSIKQTIDIPLYIQGTNQSKFLNSAEASTTFIVKTSQDYILIGNNEGLIYLYKYDQELDKFSPGNFDLNMTKIKKSMDQNIPRTLSTKLSEVDVLIQTSCFKNNPIFDIVGNWLVYSPTKYEYDHLRTVNEPHPIKTEDTDPIISKMDQESIGKGKSIFTAVKLPPPGPILNRVLETLSNSALDGIFKLSEASSNKLRSYLSKEKKQKSDKKEEKDITQSLNSFGKTIGKILYSTASTTASTIHKSASNFKPNDNQLIKIIDLSNDRVMATFKPPGGVSNLSLSPYDLQLVNSTLRGDNFYAWDLYKLPNEISLIGKFLRGKTSSTIKEIFWFVNNYDNEVVGNNSGFGCLSGSSGSVHWFNINYLSGNLSNYPNILGKENMEENINHDKFLDSWILSSLDAKKFVKLPNISNSSKAINKNYYFNQLAIIDEKNQLKLISTLNGCQIFKYELPINPVHEDLVPCEKYFEEVSTETDTDVNPLSQTEIETCAPYLNLVNNKNISFSVYKFDNALDGKSDFDCLKWSYKEFGNDVPTSSIKFNNGNGMCSSPMDYEPDLMNDFTEGLVIDQTANEHVNNYTNESFI